jgi:hypothetical protein
LITARWDLHESHGQIAATKCWPASLYFDQQCTDEFLDLPPEFWAGARGKSSIFYICYIPYSCERFPEKASLHYVGVKTSNFAYHANKTIRFWYLTCKHRYYQRPSQDNQ